MFIVDEPEKKYVKLTQKSPAWTQTDGLAVYTRAALEVMPECPSSYIWLINEALEKGWIRQVAYVEEKTLMWETLQK